MKSLHDAIEANNEKLDHVIKQLDRLTDIIYLSNEGNSKVYGKYVGGTHLVSSPPPS